MRRRQFISGLAGLGLVGAAGRALAGDPMVTELRQDGLVGRLYAAPDARRRPAVLMLGGSGGGFPYEDAARAMAAAGHPVLALAYFRGWQGQADPALTGLPAMLKDIPLEYFFRALTWMKARREVNPRKIALMGESRGGELVLQLAALRPDIAGVVAFVPSHLRWGAVGGQGDSWTLAGRALPYARDAWKPGQASVDGFIQTLDHGNPAMLAAAAIPVEKIRGRVLLFSTRADKIWPSTRMAEAVMQRLRRGVRDHYAFEDASHLLMGPGPGMTAWGEGAYRIEFGGSPEGTRMARDAAWARSVEFMDRL
ncbi:MAG: dienelactone hydrolase family protein [Caulobacteraceae bacterium]|nr:dienelactone hydrolase family protein [Caulobacteraceae bacterium]